MINEEEQLNELMQTSEFAKVPNIIQELFHKMNNKIESLTNKINFLENKNKDIVTKDYLNTVCATKVDINDF